MLSEMPAVGARNPRIALVRVFCIFGMIYVHVPQLETGYSGFTGHGIFQFDFLKSFLIEGYGRTSACLLSVVSGYLVAKTLIRNNKKITLFYRQKFKSIYFPMLIWGLVSVALFSIVSLSKPTFLNEVCGFEKNAFTSCANVVFHLTAMSDGPTMHLAFLRDLFVCMLLAPLLVIVLRKAPVVLLAILLIVYLVDMESVLILRPLVILGFSIGLYIALYRINANWIDDLWLLWTGLAAVVTLVIIGFNQGQFQNLQWFFSDYGLDVQESLLYPLSRLFGALCIWSITAKLISERSLRLSKTWEPYLFVAFCSHPLLLSALQNVGSSLLSNGAMESAYPIWFLVAPAIAIALARFGTVAFGVLVPGLVDRFTGGRAAIDSSNTLDNDKLIPLSG